MHRQFSDKPPDKLASSELYKKKLAFSIAADGGMLH
jgi:hypothetical protein